MPLSPPIISWEIVGTLKFGAFNIGRGMDSVWRTTGFGTGAAGDGGAVLLVLIRENSSNEAAFAGVGVGVDGMGADFGIATEVAVSEIGAGAGVDVGINSAIGGRISSKTLGAAVPIFNL